MENKTKRIRKPKAAAKVIEETTVSISNDDINQNEEKPVELISPINVESIINFKESILSLIDTFDNSLRNDVASNLDINNRQVTQHVEALTKKINVLEERNKELNEFQQNFQKDKDLILSEKSGVICENVKLKDRITFIEADNKRLVQDLEESNKKVITLKSQFEEYKEESTNSYSVLKNLYNDAKLENSVFLNKLEKMTKEYDTSRSDFNRYKLETNEKLEKVTRDYEHSKNEVTKLKNEYNTKLESEIQSFKNVSILNTYLKEIDNLKNEISILNQKLNTNKKLLEQSNKDNKELSNKLETLSSPEEVTEEEQEEVEEEQEEVVEEQEEVLEEQEEVVEEQEEVVEEIDVSKFDIIEVDDKEYYVDLDNNILDKETIEIVGKLTDDGEAIFNS